MDMVDQPLYSIQKERRYKEGRVPSQLSTRFSTQPEDTLFLIFQFIYKTLYQIDKLSIINKYYKGFLILFCDDFW